MQAIISTSEIFELQHARRQIRVENSVRDYVVKIARATRKHGEIELGASPRATLALYQASQAWAGIHGRDFVLPDDVKQMAPHVLTHRLMISPQAQLRGRNPEELVASIVETVPVPVEA
jgi:MoxR-like ATPase